MENESSLILPRAHIRALVRVAGHSRDADEQAGCRNYGRSVCRGGRVPGESVQGMIWDATITMTRKKWNRLRRQRPELFQRWPAWEKFNDYQLANMVRYSKSDVIAYASASLIGGSMDDGGWWHLSQEIAARIWADHGGMYPKPWKPGIVSNL